VLHRENELVLDQSTSFSEAVEMTLSGDAILKLDRKNKNIPAHRWPAPLQNPTLGILIAEGCNVFGQ
jgi:hypothetical protein